MPTVFLCYHISRLHKVYLKTSVHRNKRLIPHVAILITRVFTAILITRVINKERFCIFMSQVNKKYNYQLANLLHQVHAMQNHQLHIPQWQNLPLLLSSPKNNVYEQ